jgi:hypothetical protein
MWAKSGEEGESDGSFVSSGGRALFEISSGELFRRYRRQTMVAGRTALLLGLAAAFVFMIVVIASRHDSVIWPIATVLTFGGLVWTVRATTQVWHHRVSRLSQASQLVVYAIGRTPIGMSYLVISPTSLAVISKDDILLARLSRADITAIAISPGMAGVGVVVACGDDFVEVPIVLKVGGPTAQAWSLDGWVGRGRLFNALLDDLRRNQFPVSLFEEHGASIL